MEGGDLQMLWFQRERAQLPCQMSKTPKGEARPWERPGRSTLRAVRSAFFLKGAEGKAASEIWDPLTLQCGTWGLLIYFMSFLSLFNIEKLLILCLQKAIFKHTRNGSYEVPVVPTLSDVPLVTFH